MARAAENVIWCNEGMFPVRYCFCPSAVAWRKLMRKFRLPAEPYPDTHGAMAPFEFDGIQHAVVTLGPELDKEIDPVKVIGPLSHEAVHVWQEVRHYMSETSPSSEFEAYGIQSIIEELLRAFQKTRGRKLTLSSRSRKPSKRGKR